MNVLIATTIHINTVKCYHFDVHVVVTTDVVHTSMATTLFVVVNLQGYVTGGSRAPLAIVPSTVVEEPELGSS